MEKEKKAQHSFIKESSECMLKAAKHEKVFDEEEHLMGYKKRTYKGKKKRNKEP